MPPVAAIPTNQPKVRDLPSKFFDRLNPLKQNVSAGFLFLFSLPSPALLQSARRAAVKNPSFLLDVFPVRLAAPLTGALCPLATQPAFPHTPLFFAQRTPLCVFPVCKRPGSILAVCVVFSLLLVKQAAQRLPAAFACISALPCPAAVSS